MRSGNKKNKTNKNTNMVLADTFPLRNQSFHEEAVQIFFLFHRIYFILLSLWLSYTCLIFFILKSSKVVILKK